MVATRYLLADLFLRTEVEHLPTDIRNNVEVGGDENVGRDADDATGSRQ